MDKTYGETAKLKHYLKNRVLSSNTPLLHCSTSKTHNPILTALRLSLTGLT